MQLDSLNRRRKFVGRQPRGKRIELTPRDLVYFAALERHGPLSGPVLFEFAKQVAKNERGHKDRLTDLYHETKTEHGGPYLERPEQQFANVNARYLPMTYEITRFGVRALREAGIPLQAAAPPSGPYLHRFMTAAITASIELHAMAERHRFISSGEIIRHPKCPQSTRSAANTLAIRVNGTTIIPDALYGIDYGGKYRFWALEADRGTEPLNGNSRASRYLKDKIDSYATVVCLETYRHVWGIPVLSIRIVCESEGRVRHIRDIINRVVDPRAKSRFVVEAMQPPLLFQRSMLPASHELPRH